VGHTPNYGIGDSKFRKIVKFSVEFLRRLFRRKAIGGLEPAGRPTSAANYGMISIKERANVVMDSPSGQESANGKPPVIDQAPSTAKIK
jgi:hypothetical protein